MDTIQKKYTEYTQSRADAEKHKELAAEAYARERDLRETLIKRIGVSNAVVVTSHAGDKMAVYVDTSEGERLLIEKPLSPSDSPEAEAGVKVK